MLRRKQPIKRYKPITRSVTSGRNSPINRINPDTAEKTALYLKVRLIFLSVFTVCEARMTGCTYYASDVHHKRGRGKWLLVIAFFLPVCRNCHDRIGAQSTDAFESGLSVYRNRAYHTDGLHLFKADVIRVIMKCKDLLGLKITNN